MPFEYTAPPRSGELRQGEILTGLYEHRAACPPVEQPPGTEIPFRSYPHPRVLIMTADCDLLSDYRARQQLATTHQQLSERDLARLRAAILPHILVCEVFAEAEIRGWIGPSDLWRRVTQNQDERYHHLSASSIRGPHPDAYVGELSDFYLDFKQILSAPTENLYMALDNSSLGRLAIVPQVWLQDLMHRFYSFQGRVGPD